MNRPLTNFDIIEFAAKLRIPHFRGVFMRDELPKKPLKNECWVMNQAPQSHPTGTHWCALAKIGNEAFYFDSFGKLPPPLEIVKYVGKRVNIQYNYNRYQNFDEIVCGQLCLKFLHGFWTMRNEKKI